MINTLFPRETTAPTYEALEIAAAKECIELEFIIQGDDISL
jgi:hypothetical protein